MEPGQLQTETDRNIVKNRPLSQLFSHILNELHDLNQMIFTLHHFYAASPLKHVLPVDVRKWRDAPDGHPTVPILASRFTALPSCTTMNWLVKVACFKLLSGMPGGASFYRYCQEHVTHSLVPNRPRVEQKINIGLQYWKWLEAHDFSSRLLQGVHLDFGTGWHPTIPLLFYSMGAREQYLFDVVPVMNSEMFLETVRTFRAVVTDPDWPHRQLLPRLPPDPVSDLIPLEKQLGSMGMSYHAPYERKFGELSCAVDVVTSTQVLLHIPRGIMLQCFQRIYASLKSGGKFLATVYLKDLYAYVGGTSQYNHLKFSPEIWNGWINSPLMSFNRFKAPDYRELLEEAGFRIVHFEVDGPSESDMHELERIPVHASFNRYSREELGAKNLFFVAEKI